MTTECKHALFVPVPPSLYNTNAKGITLGGMADPRKDPSQFRIRCSRCGNVSRTSIEKTCPNCFKEMILGELDPDREKYFGRDYIYYAVRLRHCFNCNFTVASDEWDQ